MNGFLNSIRQADPPVERILPLRPRLWRSNDLAQYAAIRPWGAQFEGPLSDGWGYPVDGNWRPPHEHPQAWDAFVRRIAKQSRGKDIHWDLWNEPDMAGSWTGSRERFFDTWIRTARLLRDLLGPATRIGGPSTSSFQPDFFEALLRRCLDAGCPINFLSWHELEPWSDIALVERNIRHVRRAFLDDPRFRALGLTEIHVNEFVGEVDQYRPAELLAFLYFLERGGADYAARSCWARHCEDNSIDGVIDPRTREPRAPWWVHALYAAGCDHRVGAGSDFGHVVAMGYALPAAGAAATADQVQLLVGYYGHEGAHEPFLPLQLSLRGMSRILKGSRALVQVKAVRDSGTRPIGTLPVIEQHEVAVSGDQLLLDVAALRVHEVHAVTIREA